MSLSLASRLLCRSCGARSPRVRVVWQRFCPVRLRWLATLAVRCSCGRRSLVAATPETYLDHNAKEVYTMGNIKDELHQVDTGTQVSTQRVDSQAITDQVRAEKAAADQVTAAVERFARSYKWVHILDHPASVGLMQRMQRAQQLVPHSVTLVGCGLYQVASASQPGIHYNVRLDAGCTCPDSMGQNRAPFGWCKHRLASWLYSQHLMDQGCQLLDEEGYDDPQEDLADLLDNIREQAKAVLPMLQDLATWVDKARLLQQNGSQPRS